MGMTDYAQNKVTDALYRGQSLGAPATRYFALITAIKGARANSTAYTLNDTLVVPVGAGYSYYKVTTAGTSNASLPGTYLGAVGEAITDGTAVMTEQTVALDAGTYVEVSGGSYARVAVTASLANFAGTQSAGSTAASSGTNGTTSNNAAVTWPAPTGQWHPTGGMVVGVAQFDASTAGNPWDWSIMSAPKNVNSGDPAPVISIAGYTAKIGA